MKKLSYALLAVVFTALALVSCTEKEEVPPTDIDLSFNHYAMVTGQTLQLKVYFFPENAWEEKIKWSSSDPTTAQVDKKGVVTAVQNGTATITAKSESGLKATCEITVGKVKAEGVYLSLDKTKLTVGATLQLYAFFSPDYAIEESVQWSSSAPEKASVSSSGLVTGKDDGTATITARSESGLKATCEITVGKGDPNTIKSITVTSPTSSTLSVEDGALVLLVGKTYQINATFSPSDAEDALEYVISKYDNSYLTVSSTGLLTPKAYFGSPIPVTIKSKSGSASTVLKVRVYDPLEAINLTCPSQYIGQGVERSYWLSFTPATTAYVGNITVSSAGSILTASTKNNRWLNVKAAALSDSQVSTKSKTVSSSVTIKCGPKDSPFTKNFTFNISKYDPYVPKPGDLVANEGSADNPGLLCYDGGYRGNGVIEEGVSETPEEAFAIIACISSEKEDTKMTGYYGGLPHGITVMSIPDGSDKAITNTGWKHGIAIPTNTDGLYRKESVLEWITSSDGEKWQGEHSANIIPSGYTEGLITVSHDAMSKGTHKHTAFHNTAALLKYDNDLVNAVYDDFVRPVIYSADDSFFRKYFSASDLRFREFYYGSWTSTKKINTVMAKKAALAMSSSVSSKNCTPWLLPTVTDLLTVFSGQYAAAETGLYLSGSDLVGNQVNMLTSIAKRYNKSISYFKTYWTSQQCDTDYAWSVTVENTLVTAHDENKDYKHLTLPILYF